MHSTNMSEVTIREPSLRYVSTANDRLSEAALIKEIVVFRRRLRL
jgi:hypothetical protein